MASEKSILRALDLLTIAPQVKIEALSFAAHAHVTKMRRVVDTKNVIAVGISEKITQGKPTGALALTFYVDRKLSLNKMGTHVAVPPTVPEAVGGPEAIPTDIVVIGRPRLEIKQLKNPLAVRKPIQSGYSIGHVEATAGTLGAIVSKDNKFLLLSNSHVLAKSGLANKGDDILYPANKDGGKSPSDVIAKLFDFVELESGNDFVNRVDCAVALPLADRAGDLLSEIKGLFVPRGTIKPVRDMEVAKVGRTTGKTKGKVKDINFRFIIEYPGIGNVGYLDQVLCTCYSDDGDSGSLVFDVATEKAVGLHFAGFPDKNGIMGSVFNPISEVLKSLGVKLVTKSIK